MERESFMDEGADWHPDTESAPQVMDSSDGGDIIGDLPENTNGDLSSDDDADISGDLPEKKGGDLPPDDDADISGDLPLGTAIEMEKQPLHSIERFENEKDVSALEVKTDHDIYKPLPNEYKTPPADVPKVVTPKDEESLAGRSNTCETDEEDKNDGEELLADALKNASDEEKELYASYPIKPGTTDGRLGLMRTDLDPLNLDKDGICNLDLTQKGKPPKLDGESVELHHIGQKMDAPYAELTQEEHRGAGVDAVLHDKSKTSEIDRKAFAKEKEHYWKARTHEILKKEIAEAEAEKA